MGVPPPGGGRGRLGAPGAALEVDRPRPAGRVRRAAPARSAAGERRGALPGGAGPEAARHQASRPWRRPGHERLRALPEPLGRRLHGPRGRDREARPGPRGRDARHGVRHREPHQHPDRHPHLADDLPDDAQDRLRVDQGRREAAGRAGRDPRRELAGEALLDGLPRVALLPSRLHAVDRARAGQRVHRGRHHPRRGALHRHGVRLVVPRGRRPRLHARSGGGERPHHAGRLRPGREVPRLGGVGPPGALRGPPLLGLHLRRHPPRGGLHQPPASSSGGRAPTGSPSASCRSSSR